MVLSDVEGMCKFYSITSKRVVPLTRVDGSSLVSVKYTLKSTDSTSFTLFDNIKPVIDEIATLSNQSVRLASVMSRPLMQQAADEFNSLVTKNSLVSVSGDVAIDFDFKSKKGLTFQPSGFPGNTLVIDLVVEPGFSVYTSDTIGTGSETRPKYNPIVNVYNVPVYAIEQTGEIKPISVKEHFAIDPEARQKFSRIHSANVADVGEFVSACGDIRDDLQNRVKLVSDDLIDDFVYILGQSHWVDTPILHNSDCITTPELDEARQLGIRIPSNDPVRVGVIRNMNTIIDNIMANLASSSEIARRTFFDRLLSSNIYFGDPSGFLVTSPSPRDALLLDLSKARISVYGCYYSPSDGPATVRTALFSTLDGKARGALTVYAMPIDDKTQVGDIKINEIEVRELRKDDPNSSFLISRIPGDARTAACGQLLEKYFAGFPGV
jgi:hypothetical protein